LKNHINVNGKLIQTNKRFSQLKNKQKEWIAAELYKLYHNKMKERHTIRKLPPDIERSGISPPFPMPATIDAQALGVHWCTPVYLFTPETPSW
jgi:hypothetical protein